MRKNVSSRKPEILIKTKYKHDPYFIVTIPESRTTFWSISFIGPDRLGISVVDLIERIAGQVWLHGKGCGWEDVHWKEEVLLVSLPARSLAKGPEGAFCPWAPGPQNPGKSTLPLEHFDRLTGTGGKDGVLGGAFKGLQGVHEDVRKRKKTQTQSKMRSTRI